MAQFNVGDKVRIVRTVSVFNLCDLREGMTGTVTWVKQGEPLHDQVVADVLLDDDVPGLEHWNNELQVTLDGEVTWDLFERCDG